MQLTWLEVRDFRCYPELTFSPEPGVNVLVGANGSGKTSVLEAIAYLSALRSFRGVGDAALVRAGTATAVVRGEFRHEASHLVEVELPLEGRRRVLVNGKRPARYGSVAASVPVVAFLPDDLDLVKRGPALRRGYLDGVAAQRWPAAAGEQQDYERALRQRNALLREHGRDVDPGSLDVWDAEVATHGATVLRRRLELLGELGPRLAGAYREIAAGTEELAWTYEAAGLEALEGLPGAPALAERLQAALAARRRADMDRRVTTVGPHRADPGFLVGHRDARTRASQGEQRSVALAMRLAAYDVLEAAGGVKPILVLDDVFSELDDKRAAGLTARLPGGQVFVTTARAEDVSVGGRVWEVRDGSVR